MSSEADTPAVDEGAASIEFTEIHTLGALGNSRIAPELSNNQGEVAEGGKDEAEPEGGNLQVMPGVAREATGTQKKAQRNDEQERERKRELQKKRKRPRRPQRRCFCARAAEELEGSPLFARCVTGAIVLGAVQVGLRDRYSQCR